MVQPMEATVLQGARNILFHSGWEISDIGISEPGIVELADVEAELCCHHPEASNSQLHVRISVVHLTVAAITDEEIVNRRMLETNASIDHLISV